MQYQIHPLAEIFPRMTEKEIDELAADIKAHGLREPIWLIGDQVIDGRHRMIACERAGVPLQVRQYEGDNPAAFVVSLNLKRRHLNESQRAMVASGLANLERGRPDGNAQTCAITQSGAAEMLNVSRRAVQSAKQVTETGTSDLVQAVQSGAVSVSAAADVATLPPEEQTQIVARGEAEILKAAKEIRAAKAETRRAELAELKRQAPPLPDGCYETIVIDPPWQMEKIERDVSPNQVAFDYPTMSEAELSAFDLPSVMADDCHVFCWTTHKHLPVALRLVEAWGLKYVLTMVWHKPGGFQPFGLPQYNCEFCIYARRGSPSFADTKAFPVCFDAPRREHSRKPDEFYDVIRRVTDGPRIDVFSRELRDGFDQFGNEAGKFAA